MRNDPIQGENFYKAYDFDKFMITKKRFQSDQNNYSSNDKNLQSIEIKEELKFNQEPRKKPYYEQFNDQNLGTGKSEKAEDITEKNQFPEVSLGNEYEYLFVNTGKAIDSKYKIDEEVIIDLNKKKEKGAEEEIVVDEEQDECK